MIYENEIHSPQVPRYHVTPDGAEVAIDRRTALACAAIAAGLAEWSPPAAG